MLLLHVRNDVTFFKQSPIHFKSEKNSSDFDPPKNSVFKRYLIAENLTEKIGKGFQSKPCPFLLLVTKLQKLGGESKSNSGLQTQLSSTFVEHKIGK